MVADVSTAKLQRRSYSRDILNHLQENAARKSTEIKSLLLAFLVCVKLRRSIQIQA